MYNSLPCVWITKREFLELPFLSLPMLPHFAQRCRNQVGGQSYSARVTRWQAHISHRNTSVTYLFSQFEFL